ncbi:hypothetical protein [Rossellomorea marisflavi]|uniref:hypothetical protein n=1 Tax=Rossellomorea marisflavi TaxID=189381 RepID=UPI003D2F4537
MIRWKNQREETEELSLAEKDGCITIQSTVHHSAEEVHYSLELDQSWTFRKGSLRIGDRSLILHADGPASRSFMPTDLEAGPSGNTGPSRS